MEGTAALICRAGTDHRGSAAAQTRQPATAVEFGAAVLVTGGSGRGPVRPGGAASDRRRPRYRRARPPRGGGGGGRGGGGQTLPRAHSCCNTVYY